MKDAVIQELQNDENYEVIGDFENDIMQRFVIYKDKLTNEIYMTGDEFLWELGYVWGLDEYVGNEFLLSTAEHVRALQEFNFYLRNNNEK